MLIIVPDDLATIYLAEPEVEDSASIQLQLELHQYEFTTAYYSQSQGK